MERVLEIFAANPVFAVAIMLVLGIALLEGVLTLIGFGLSSLLDSLLPDINIETNLEIDSPNHTFGELFSWINKGNVPFIMILLSFIAYFGILGILIQENLNKIFGFYGPLWIVIPAVILLTLPLIRWTTITLSRLIPQDETSAVSKNTLIDSVGKIVLGTASHDKAAEAKVYDQHGQTHYVMVKSMKEGDIFNSGDSVVIMSLTEQGHFKVMRDSNDFAK